MKRTIGFPTRLAAVLILGLAVFIPATVLPAAAQTTDPVPHIENAERAFRQGLRSFELGDWQGAYSRFRAVYSDYPLNRRTTAAMLMGGRALVRDGRYDEGVRVLEELRRMYPTSGYLGEAQHTITAARALRERDQIAAQTLHIGVALPLTGADPALTYELFNGIRLAVDDHNAAGRRPARLIFRDTGNDPTMARSAIQDLAAEGVHLIIGPLFSDEAVAAAEAAERARVVMIAPMATDEAVARGRRHVFQANSTLTTRGRVLARYMYLQEGTRRFGVIAELGNSVAERMAEGFQDEALVLGAEVSLYHLLHSSHAWSTVAEEVGAEALEQAGYIYMPMAGSGAPNQIRNVLGSLEQENVNVRILGNSEWRDRVSAEHARRFSIIYENDFHVQDATASDFEARYRQISTHAPGRLAYGGYDVTRFAIGRLLEQGDQPLVDVIRDATAFQGLGTRIHFRGRNTNEAVFIHRYVNGRAELIR
jgi:branched-chain amino acid transport system substrate-binding protein